MEVIEEDYSKLNGWLLVDKPVGITSFAVVALIRRQLGIKKVGHGGTLDPLASGVLPIALGEATKTADYILKSNKTYEFIIDFGYNTTTLDSEGEKTKESNVFPSENQLLEVLKEFRGKIEQTPPNFSALKVDGKRAYDLARKGIEFELQKRSVEIFTLELLEYSLLKKQIKLIAEVSKGTYIRSLAQDIVDKLQSCGHISYLRRVSISSCKKILLISQNKLYNIKSCVKDSLIGMEDMLDDISAYLLKREQALLLSQGNLRGMSADADLKNGVIKALYEGKLIALLKYEDGNFSFLRGFNTEINFNNVN